MTRRRWIGLLVGVLTLVVPACSDAYTQAEKDATDDGVDPRVVTVFFAERYGDAINRMLDRYESTDAHVRFVRALVTEPDVPDRVRENSSPSVWIGDATALDDAGDAGPVDAAVTVGGEPLVVAMRSPLAEDRPGLAAFAAGGELETILCEASCAALVQTAMESAGVTAAPARTVPSAAEAMTAVLDGDADITVVPNSYGAGLFPRIAQQGFSDDPPLAPIELRRWGRSDVSVEFFDWLAGPALPALAALLELRTIT